MISGPSFRDVAGLLLAGLVAALAAVPPALAGNLEEALAGRMRELADYGWTLERESHGVQVLTRDTSGSTVREIRAVALAPAPPEALMAVVAAYDDYPDFMPYVVESRVLPSPDGVTRVFQHLDLGPPIRDRVYTIRMTDFRSPHDGSLGVTWTLETAPEFQHGAKGVRPPVNQGGWQFTPVGDGSTSLVDYLIRSDPGGWVPRWAAAMALRSSVPKVVNTVSRRAGRGP